MTDATHSDHGERQAPGGEGVAALNAAHDFITRFCVLPSDAAYDAMALWAAHAHVIDAFDSTPRLAFLSPEPGSGKTRALEILALLVPFPMHAVNASAAALYRSVGNRERRPTVLFDEIDTVFGPKAKDNEDLRGLLNAGHRRAGVAYRCVGEGTNQGVQEFPAYAAVALAGIGNLPDTILTRSVIVRMRRRAPHERVEPYRARIHEPEGWKIRAMLADWVATQAERLGDAWPEMPPGITDRPADVWEPLLAIADAAGGEWPKRARDACVYLVKQGAERAVSLGIRLLMDLHRIFDGTRALFTETVLERLHGIEDAPWAELKGVPLDSRGLSRLLSQYDVAPVKVKIEGRSLMGYRADHLADAWARYLPATSAEEPEPAEPSEPAQLTKLDYGSGDRSGSGTFGIERPPLVPQVPEP